MRVLENLEPKNVFYFFEEISRIPRPSYKEEKISNYLVNFAKERNLEVYQDDLKNVIIIKEATKGYEDVEPIILQGHMDMVCEKEPDCTIDFEKDPLTLEIEGDYITAKGTTLGGDDGIAVAYALAILDSDTIEHPRLEVVITVSEEVGMDGANGIDLSMLKGKKVLNLDSEEEGHMLASCAGGCTTVCRLPLAFEKKSGELFEIHIFGLLGGHSGGEIDKERANSNLLMGRFFLRLSEKTPFAIAELAGGTKDNAIPRETTAKIMLETGKEDLLMQEIAAYQEILTAEYQSSDKDIKVRAKALGNGEERVTTVQDAEKVTMLLTHLPAGIQRMSMDIKGLVETSLNLGILYFEEDAAVLKYSVRSSVKTQKELLVQKLKSLTEWLGGSISIYGDYPAWEYKKDSRLRDDMVAVYERMYGKKPSVEAIHAGLECGLLSAKIPGMDAVSIGPDMIDIHTTGEKLSISSTKRVWEYVLEVLKCK